LPPGGAQPMIQAMSKTTLFPDPQDSRLVRTVAGLDQDGRTISLAVAEERPLTLFLNGQEIVTQMTIGDHPRELAVGYLLNQLMLKPSDRITAIDHDPAIDTVVVRTLRRTDFEEKLKKKTQTSGCAQGTVFGDLMEDFDAHRLALDGFRLSAKALRELIGDINARPSLYRTAGALHGCVLCDARQPLIYMEDVGRHNAVDKIAGLMALEGVAPQEKILYTTGRLTSEMVVKTVRMGIPILVSCSGFTAWGVELAAKANLTLIGRAKGRNFLVLSAPERLILEERAP